MKTKLLVKKMVLLTNKTRFLIKKIGDLLIYEGVQRKFTE